MFVTSVYVFLAVACVAMSSPVSNSPNAPTELVLYYSNGDEPPFDTSEDHSDGLPSAAATHYCASGVWIIYPTENYTGTTTRVISSSTSQICGAMEFGAAIVKSTRIAGLRPDNSVPSVSVFSGYDFSLERLVFGEAVPDVPFSVQSYITINSPRFEVFQYPDYQGRSLCLQDYNCASGVCLRWWFGPSMLPWGTDVKSAKVGCGPSAPIHNFQD